MSTPVNIDIPESLTRIVCQYSALSSVLCSPSPLGAGSELPAGPVPPPGSVVSLLVAPVLVLGDNEAVQEAPAPLARCLQFTL